MSSTTFADPEKPEGSPSRPVGDRLETSGASPSAGVTDEAPVSRVFPLIYLSSFLAVILIAIAINFLGNGTNLLPSPGFPSGSDRAWKARRLEAQVRSGSAASRPSSSAASRVTGFGSRITSNRSRAFAASITASAWAVRSII